MIETQAKSVMEFCELLDGNIGNDVIEANNPAARNLGFSYEVDGVGHVVYLSLLTLRNGIDDLPCGLGESAMSNLISHYSNKGDDGI